MARRTSASLAAHDSSGAPLGPEFRVNAFTLYNQFVPSVAADTDGNFVVVWHSYVQDNSAFGIFGQRYASAGPRSRGVPRQPDLTTDDPLYPSVAADAAGNFVVRVAQRRAGRDSSSSASSASVTRPILPVELMHFSLE